MAVLMGANTRTYKFALGTALLSHAAQGRTEVSLPELAQPYAMTLAEHAAEMPQARQGSSLGEADFLSILLAESTETLSTGAPTEKLVDAAVRSMPGMVMQKFHNLAGSTEVPHRFYELDGAGRHRVVRLTPQLLRVARAGEREHLRGELDARWRIVETSFSTGVGASLISEGLVVDTTGTLLTDKRRRRNVAGVTQAVIGFQYSRCLICDIEIGPEDLVAVDHMFPYSLMSRGFTKLDLDAIWNLSPAHAACNGTKSNRVPYPVEVQRLAARNIAIMGSPHPLRRTLELTLQAHGYPGRSGDWSTFLQALLA